MANELVWSKMQDYELDKYKKDPKSYYASELPDEGKCFTMDELSRYYLRIRDDYQKGDNYNLVFKEPEVLW